MCARPISGRGPAGAETEDGGGPADSEAGTAPIHVAVQHSQRLFRHGLRQLLDAADGIEVVGTAVSDGDLVAACRNFRPAVAVFEAALVLSNGSLLGVLRQTLPRLSAVGLTILHPTVGELARARHLGMTALVPRDAGIAGIVDAVRSPHRRPALYAVEPASRDAEGNASTVLTVRELEILSLVGAGLTSVGVSGRLNISHKTVENHKQRIFAKLGVQNQAHAVSVAIRRGILRADRVIDLAVAD